MTKKKIYTPSLRGFYENIGRIEGVEIKESKLDTKFDEIVLLTGSILDKSEIDYREITRSQGKYYTIIPINLKKNDVDEYWVRHSIVMYKAEITNYLMSL